MTWAKVIGVTFFDKLTKLIIALFVPLLEWIPLLNAFPWWSVSLILLGIIVSREDRLYNKQVQMQREEIARYIHTDAQEQAAFEQQAIAANVMSQQAVAHATRRAANDNRDEQALRNIRMRPPQLKNIQYQAANQNRTAVAA